MVRRLTDRCTNLKSLKQIFLRPALFITAADPSPHFLSGIMHIGHESNGWSPAGVLGKRAHPTATRLRAGVPSFTRRYVIPNRAGTCRVRMFICFGRVTPSFSCQILDVSGLNAHKCRVSPPLLISGRMEVVAGVFRRLVTSSI